MKRCVICVHALSRILYLKYFAYNSNLFNLLGLKLCRIKGTFLYCWYL